MIIFIFYVKTINYWSNLCNRDPAIDTELSHVVSLIIFSSSLTLLISRVLTVRLITNTFGQTHTHFLSRWNPSFASSTKKKGSATKKVFGCWTQFFYFRFFFLHWNRVLQLGRSSRLLNPMDRHIVAFPTNFGNKKKSVFGC